MLTIATRRYHDINPNDGCEFELIDRVVRKPTGDLALMIAGERPGDPEVETSISLEDYFEWLRDCSDQIRFAVVSISH